jgi:hypothetical protein
MIGTARAKGKMKSTTAAGPVEKARGMKRKGVAPRINLPAMSDSGGDNEQHAVAKRSTKGMRPGPGLPLGKGIEPFRDKNSEGQSFKTVGPRNNSSDAGGAIDEWCKGKRASYR